VGEDDAAEHTPNSISQTKPIAPLNASLGPIPNRDLGSLCEPSAITDWATGRHS